MLGGIGPIFLLHNSVLHVHSSSTISYPVCSIIFSSHPNGPSWFALQPLHHNSVTGLSSTKHVSKCNVYLLGRISILNLKLLYTTEDFKLYSVTHPSVVVNCA